MLMYNQSGLPQGALGPVNFKEYGTMLQILNVHMLADGRSLIETRGMFRFRVLGHGTLDGYKVGRVERLEDLSLVEEERVEADEIAAGTASQAAMAAMSAMAANPTVPGAGVDLDGMTTQQLLSVGLEFIQKMRGHSAPWLHQRIIQSYGDAPNDPALFPYWFASVVPIVDEEKYQLMGTTSVRDRLKMVVRWTRRIESQRL
jgi:Lon protease-like protein